MPNKRLFFDGAPFFEAHAQLCAQDVCPALVRAKARQPPQKPRPFECPEVDHFRASTDTQVCAAELAESSLYRMNKFGVGGRAKFEFIKKVNVEFACRLVGVAHANVRKTNTVVGVSGILSNDAMGRRDHFFGIFVIGEDAAKEGYKGSIDGFDVSVQCRVIRWKHKGIHAVSLLKRQLHRRALRFSI